MSTSGGISQLLKGMIIGVVLIMAIIGTMSLLDENSPISSFIAKNTAQPPISSQESKEIIAPSITLNPDINQNSSHENTTSTDNNVNIGDLNAKIPDIDENSTVDNVDTDNIVTNNETNSKPLLGNEKAPEEKNADETPPINYGIMEIKAVNSTNSEVLKVNYSVFDRNNVKVAESKNVNNTSYRLPSGQYKVETTLTKVDDATNQTIPVLTKSRYIIVRDNATTNQTFELELPATTGVLQVSAKISDKIIRASYVIEKPNGEIVASRNNVTNSLFKLSTGTYNVSITNGDNKDFRSVEIKAGESTQTTFILKEAAKQGKLLIKVFDIDSGNPVRANIIITATDGTVMQDLSSITQTELTLAEGDYKVLVIGPSGTSNKNIRVNSGQVLNEVFRFDNPNTETVSIDKSTDNTQINDNVIIKAGETSVTTTVDPVNADNNKVTLNIITEDELTKKPIKSNIYIQTPQGQHLDKRTYVDAASFSLEPGVYKVTVRAKNRINKVKTIRLSQNKNISDTFTLVKPNNQTAESNTNKPSNPPSVETSKATNSQNSIVTGFLNVSMQAANNLQNLKTHFIVSSIDGQKIVELTSVNKGDFKLDIGSYIVTAIHNNKRKNQRIDIKHNQNTRLVFNTTDFLDVKGELRSRIVNESGRPLKGNLIVRNQAGEIIARANDVSSAVFNLPPVRHTISVNFQGLSGSEIVNINENETTIQTFTISSN